jgi:hypothetical protein
MPIHLTPTELAHELGLDRREVLLKAVELGVPIFDGRIDKVLFMSSLQAAGPDPAAIAAKADHFTLLDDDGNLIDSFDDEARAQAVLQDILASEPEARGHIALIAYDATGHPLGELTRRQVPART